jgi:hypothetical protein
MPAQVLGERMEIFCRFREGHGRERPCCTGGADLLEASSLTRGAESLSVLPMQSDDPCGGPGRRPRLEPTKPRQFIIAMMRASPPKK